MSSICDALFFIGYPCLSEYATGSLQWIGDAYQAGPLFTCNNSASLLMTIALFALQFMVSCQFPYYAALCMFCHWPDCLEWASLEMQLSPWIIRTHYVTAVSLFFFYQGGWTGSASEQKCYGGWFKIFILIGVI